MQHLQVRASRYTRSTFQSGETADSHFVENGPEEVSIAEEFKCNSTGCMEAAALAKSFIDDSIDPCENFYQFACGNYIKITEIPEGKGMVDTFTALGDLVQQQLHEVVMEPLQLNESRSFQLARDFHLACLNETIIEERGLSPLIDILDELGGWPVLEGDTWIEDAFNWTETLKKFRHIGLNTQVIFSLYLETDLRNSSKRVLYVSDAEICLLNRCAIFFKEIYQFDRSIRDSTIYRENI